MPFIRAKRAARLWRKRSPASNNPAGRLPVTFYAGLDQLPPFSDYAMKGRTYRYFTGKPLFPFGFGLSYTSFKYSGLKLNAGTIKAGEALTAEVRSPTPASWPAMKSRNFI